MTPSPDDSDYRFLLRLPLGPPECQPASEQRRGGWMSAALTAAMLACFALGGWLLAPAIWSEPTSAVASVAPSTGPRLVTQNIEDVRLGQRVVGTNPLAHESQPASEIHPGRWRTVRLSMHAHSVDYVLAFLRPVAWLKDGSAT